MRLSGRDTGFIGLIAALVVLLFAVSGERKTKPVPDTPPHREVYRTAYRNAPPPGASPIGRLFFRADKRGAEAWCEQCHNPRKAPLPPNHPAKNRCLLCHELRPPER